jgi:protoporphyrinogen/coproporphyrinogen III oxidase
MSDAVDVAVVGAGIGGLACAWRLSRRGIDLRVLEGSSRVGGALRTVEDEGRRVELGATTVMSSAELRGLAAEVGLEGEIVEPERSLARFVFHDGRLHEVPKNPLGLAKTGLLSLSGKLALLGEPLRPRRTEEREESIAEFVSRRFGAEALERFVAPVVSGTFAGDPAKLELASVYPRLIELERTHGSVVRGMVLGPREETTRPTMLGFRRGLESLPQRLAERLGERVRLDARVRSIARAEGNGFVIALADGERVKVRSVVVALEAWGAAEVLRELSPAIADDLAAIPTPSLALVAVALPHEAVAHDLRGFGFLATPGSGLSILGAIFASTLFPDRAPADEAVLTGFVGGATAPSAAAADDATLVARVTSDLARVLGAKGEPRWSRVQRYPRSIPQYDLGHRARVARVQAEVARIPGLRLAGNYLAGISVADTVRRACAIADEITGGSP